MRLEYSPRLNGVLPRQVGYAYSSPLFGRTGEVYPTLSSYKWLKSS
jgi:hypothetical protein